MVSTITRRSESPIKIIESVLKKAGIPQHWYSIAKPFECRTSIIQQDDGLHVFIPERGERVGEQVFQDWFDAVVCIANNFELSATNRLMRVAKDTLIELSQKKQEPITFSIRTASGWSTPFVAFPAANMHSSFSEKIIDKQVFGHQFVSAHEIKGVLGKEISPKKKYKKTRVKSDTDAKKR